MKTTFEPSELDYIVSLLATRGNEDVPANAITSYLETQAVSARMAGEYTIAGYLSAASEMWEHDEYKNAKNAVNYARISYDAS